MLNEIMYTAEVTNLGARTGSVSSSDGVLELQVRQPQVLGGPVDGKYTNPEQLFAAAYAACFGGALAGVGKGKNMKDATVTAKVHIGKADTGYGIGAELHVVLPHLSQEEAQTLVENAHQLCPYSKATRGNIDVKLVATGGLWDFK